MVAPMPDDVFQVAVVGGGIGGSAAALRAAQNMVRTVWIRGDRATARASRVKYVYNVDNMIGIHPGVMRQKFLDLLDGDEHAAARAVLEKAHLHLGTQNIADNVVQRIREEFSATVTEIEEKAVAARRQGDLFIIETGDGRTIRSGAVVLSTGVMDEQPSVKMTTRTGKVVDDIRWIYPYANNETLLYCVICEGHLARETSIVVFGSSEAAAQVALMFHERYGITVAVLTNGERLQASEKAGHLLSAYGIAVHASRVVEILDGDGKGPKGASLRGFRLEDGTSVEARFGMVVMGLHRVYNDLARELGAELDERDGPDEGKRHVLVDDATSETSVPGLFAVGDMSRRRGSSPSYKQIYTAQEYAVRAVNTIDLRLRRSRREKVLAPKA
jgi:thioredoxin reductase (NADPH)